MKHLIYILGVTLALMCCTLTQAKDRIVTERDSLGNTKVVIELNDTVVNGKTVTDTLSITTYGAASEEDEEVESTKGHNGIVLFKGDLGGNQMATIISVVAIAFVFGAPVLLIFIIGYYRNKNRKEKYRLVEKALESGQPLPENLFNQNDWSDLRAKGIKCVFVGIGLFICLWALTEEFGLGCIGLLVMFNGFGKLVIYYTANKPSDKSDKSDNLDKSDSPQ